LGLGFGQLGESVHPRLIVLDRRLKLEGPSLLDQLTRIVRIAGAESGHKES
jgi:hypothetical protein